MDLRGYSLPIQFGYPPFPQPHASETGSGPRVSNEYQRDYAFGDLSLSDGPGPRDMPLRCGSSKDHIYKGSIRSPDGKHHKPKKHVPATRNPNPGIDVALRNLDHDVRTSLRISQAFVQDFDTQIKPLQEWAEDFTLDTIWRNIVRNKCRDKRDGERFGGMPERILRSRVSIKEAIGKAKTLKATWDDQHGIERQIRTGKKALLYCDGIIDLAEKAGSERLACKQLVLELNEARCLLDRRRHPWIYGEEMVEQQDDDLQKRGTQKKSSSQKSQRSEMGSDNERFEARDEGDVLEKQDEPECRFENPPDPGREDEGNSQGGGDAW